MPGRSISPAIGLTMSSRATETQRRHYRRALEDHGARVLEICPANQDASVDDLDALVLSGGGDVDPAQYREPVRAHLKNVDRNRDDLELRLARAALTRRVPVLGICRGAQILGVALGGRLVQDIGSEVSRALPHTADSDDDEAWHAVDIAPESRLCAVLGVSRLLVNSSHHQANGSLGPEVTRSAWSEDGVVEAIERNGDAFAVGVQWHPERMLDKHPGQRLLFEALVVAARSHRASTFQPKESSQ